MRVFSSFCGFSHKNAILLAFATLFFILPVVYAYSEVAKSSQCSPGQIVKINLTSKRDPKPYRLNIPCEYFRYRYLNDGNHKNIQINFFKDTMEPAWPWYEQHPEVKNSRDDEIKVRLSRAFNPDMIARSHKSAIPYFTKVTAPEVLKEMEGFDVLVSIHSTYPKGPYILYPKGQDAISTEINCIYSSGCGIFDAATYYKGLALHYDLKQQQLQNWKTIEDQAKTLVDKFTE